VKPFRHATAMPECLPFSTFALAALLGTAFALASAYSGTMPKLCFVSATTAYWLGKPHDLGQILAAVCSELSMIIIHTQLDAHVINFLFHRDVLLLFPGKVVAC
jgi:hypothetical protein